MYEGYGCNNICIYELLQVVQRMFEVMDCNREAYEKMEAEKNELDELWKKEKDNLRKTQMVCK